MSDLIFVKATKYKNTCTKCGKEIPAHSPCFWNKEAGQNFHEQCTPNAVPKQTESKPTEADSSLDEASANKRIEQQIRLRIRKARAIVAEELQIPIEQINPDSMVLYETLRQLYGSIWLEDNLKKLR